MSPHASTVMLPPLLERLRRTAPRVRIRIVAKNNTRIVPMLDSNEIDFVVGSFLDLPKRFSSIELFRDEFVCVMRRNHPLSEGPMTLERFARAHQVLITASGEEGSLFDDVLRDLGHSRPISLIVNEYLAGLLVIARTDLITGLFSRIFRIGGAFCDLALHSTSLPIAPRSIRLAWHAGLRNDPAYDWLRDEIVAVSGEIAGYERPTLVA
jgi:DNA-binding transcriptional LysR family regulator